MTSKERFDLTVNHKQPDRLVVDFGSTSVLMYPEGDTSATPSGRMPRSSFFFDAIIRQKPIVEEELDFKDNLEEYGLVSDSDMNGEQLEIKLR